MKLKWHGEIEIQPTEVQILVKAVQQRMSLKTKELLNSLFGGLFLKTEGKEAKK